LINLFGSGIFWQYSFQRNNIKVVLHMKSHKLHIWELALIGALTAALLTALWAWLPAMMAVAAACTSPAA
jgi:hypothetical protein